MRPRRRRRRRRARCRRWCRCRRRRRTSRLPALLALHRGLELELEEDRPDQLGHRGGEEARGRAAGPRRRPGAAGRRRPRRLRGARSVSAATVPRRASPARAAAISSSPSAKTWRVGVEQAAVGEAAAALEEGAADEPGGPHEGERDVVVPGAVAAPGVVEEVVEAGPIGGRDPGRGRRRCRARSARPRSVAARRMACTKRPGCSIRVRPRGEYCVTARHP